MDEKQKREFCRKLNIPYVPPAVVAAPVERKRCIRQGCDNVVGHDLRFTKQYPGYCSAACHRFRSKVKPPSSCDGSRL